jgi:hypothetical protein
MICHSPRYASRMAGSAVSSRDVPFVTSVPFSITEPRVAISSASITFCSTMTIVKSGPEIFLTIASVCSVNEWRQPERGLVQKEQLRLGHESTTDGKHLLFAARKRAGGLPPAFAQTRKHATPRGCRASAVRPWKRRRRRCSYLALRRPASKRARGLRAFGHTGERYACPRRSPRPGWEGPRPGQRWHPALVREGPEVHACPPTKTRSRSRSASLARIGRMST